MSADARQPFGHAMRVDAVKKYVHEHTCERLDREVLTAVDRRIRLERAGRKLRMGAANITQVALDAGYDTHAAFGKAFKQHFGLSPSQFRRLDCRAATRVLKKG